MTEYINDGNFTEEVMESSTPVLVDFTANWCGPCKMIAPSVDALAEEYKGRVKIVKLDIDENPATVKRFEIRAVPSLYFFKNGNVVDQLLGGVAKSDIQEKLEKVL